MKMQNKKRGFTIVELVIVIAVIAILAGVLVPTFTGIVKKAKVSARQQQATTAYHAAIGYAEFGSYDDGTEAVDAYVVITEGTDTYYFAVEGGAIATETKNVPADFEDNYKVVEMEEYGTFDDEGEYTAGAVAFYAKKAA